MRKSKRYKAYKHQLSRERSEMKKRHLPAIRRRRRSLLSRKLDIAERKRVNEKKDITKVSPSNFSLIDNTDAVVSYINDCKSLLHKKEKVIMDIENVQNLSPDARSEEHTSELQSRRQPDIVCRLLLEIGRASCRERV